MTYNYLVTYFEGGKKDKKQMEIKTNFEITKKKIPLIQDTIGTKIGSDIVIVSDYEPVSFRI